ncbi:hypothetical protein ACVIQS_000688 [Bradyrhizobium diazoefficiens]
MRSSIALIILNLSVASAYAQGDDRKIGQTSFRELVTQLPATLMSGISPPSLGGVPVPVYEDKKTNLYYISPMLLPDWSALDNTIRSKCQPDTAEEQNVTMTLEFFRDSIRQEIALRASEVKKTKIEKEQILIYPYASLYVEVNARSGRFPRRQILQDPPLPLDAYRIQVQALRVSPPRPYTAQFSASCSELKNILTTKDISGQFLAPYADVAVNSFSIVYNDFVVSEQVKDIFRDEKSRGGQIVTSSSRSSGAGLNIGGHLGAKAGGSDSTANTMDTRTRSITSNLVAGAAAEFTKNLLIMTWTEFGGNTPSREKVSEELLKFILANSVPIDAQIKQLKDGMWLLTAGTESRSLKDDELKQILEGVSKQTLEFSEKAGGGYDGFKLDVDKQSKGSDDADVKWEKQGAAWVPTSLRLYAVSSDRITQSARAQVVDVLVKNKGMLASQLDPVADNFVPNQDMMDIVRKEIAGLKADLNRSFPKIRDLTQGKPIGMDLQQVSGHTGTNNWKNCDPGQVVTGVNPYVEDNHIKFVLNCQLLPILSLP